MIVSGGQVETTFHLRIRLDGSLDTAASRHHVRQYGAPAPPPVELRERAHHVRLLVHARHDVECVAHPRPTVRLRAPIVERLGRNLHALEHELELQERRHFPFGNKSQLPLHPPVARTVNEHVLASNVVIGHHPLEFPV